MATAPHGIEATAPVRVCDNGGWTDTWFGGPGRILNLAVAPGVRVWIRHIDGPDPVVIDARSFDERYPIVPGAPREARHPLVEAAIDAFPPPGSSPVEIGISSAVPPGCGAGTSAAVGVALLGGLCAARSEAVSRRRIAYAAHRLEVEVLGGQSGIQDQLSSAFGGINYLEIDRYPEATLQACPAWDELDSLLTLIFLGRSHDSSGLHRRVIEAVQGRPSAAFTGLRAAAVAARDAVLGRDVTAFGRAMITNTEAQQSLHPDLVGADARRIIDLASDLGAVGWKVNGAGGEGGSVTILNPSFESKIAFERRAATVDPRYQVLPVRISRAGLQVRSLAS